MRATESVSVCLCGHESFVSDVSFISPLGHSYILRIADSIPLSFCPLTVFCAFPSSWDPSGDNTFVCSNPDLTEARPRLQQSPIGADWTHLTSPWSSRSALWDHVVELTSSPVYLSLGYLGDKCVETVDFGLVIGAVQSTRWCNAPWLIDKSRSN